jgi:hypothetical protein
MKKLFVVLSAVCLAACNTQIKETPHVAVATVVDTATEDNSLVKELTAMKLELQKQSAIQKSVRKIDSMLNKLAQEQLMMKCQMIVYSTSYDANTRIRYAKIYKKLSPDKDDIKILNNILLCEGKSEMEMCVKQASLKKMSKGKEDYELVIKTPTGKPGEE